MPSTTLFALLAFATAAFAIPNPSPSSSSTFKANPVMCDTKTVFDNALCIGNHVCIPNPDIVCTAVFPSTCLKGYCLPYIFDDEQNPQRCGITRGQAKPLKCVDEDKEDGQTCVENPKVADALGYCIWKDGRYAQVMTKPRGGPCKGNNVPREVGEGLQKRIVCVNPPVGDGP